MSNEPRVQFFGNNQNEEVLADPMDNAYAPPETQDQVDNLVEEYQQSVVEEQNNANLMSEAERRFELASYYKALMQNSFFDGDSSDSAQMVESEIREFVTERLQVLLGMKSGPSKLNQVQVQPQFTEPEAEKLKVLLNDENFKVITALLSKLQGKTVQAPAPTPAAPKVNSVVVKPTPVLNKINAKPVPALDKRPVTPVQSKNVAVKPSPNKNVAPKEKIISVRQPKPGEAVSTQPKKLRKGEEPVLNEPYIDPDDNKVKKVTIGPSGAPLLQVLSGQNRASNVAKPRPVTAEQWNSSMYRQADFMIRSNDLLTNKALASMAPASINE